VSRVGIDTTTRLVLQGHEHLVGTDASNDVTGKYGAIIGDYDML
jgi:hypothetical protein